MALQGSSRVEDSANSRWVGHPRDFTPPDVSFRAVNRLDMRTTQRHSHANRAEALSCYLLAAFAVR